VAPELKFSASPDRRYTLFELSSVVSPLSLDSAFKRLMAGYINPFTDFGFKREQFYREEHPAYDESLKYYRDLTNSLDTARMEGIEEGRELGLQEGKMEAKRELAVALLQKGMSREEVAALTGLPLEDIVKDEK